MMNSFLNQIPAQFDELQRMQPLLELRVFENRVLISGAYCIRLIYENEEYADLFEIESIFQHDFPKTLPIVKEIGGRIRRWGFEHIYPDRTLCLEVDTRMKMELDQFPSLIFFFEKYVSMYFLSYLYYGKYRKFPFGERSHNIDGLLEFYSELFDVHDKKAARVLLNYVCGPAVKGHHPCPCLSGKRYRDCHRSKITELKEGKYLDLFISDLKLVERA